MNTLIATLAGLIAGTIATEYIDTHAIFGTTCAVAEKAQAWQDRNNQGLIENTTGYNPAQYEKDRAAFTATIATVKESQK